MSDRGIDGGGELSWGEKLQRLDDILEKLDREGEIERGEAEEVLYTSILHIAITVVDASPLTWKGVASVLNVLMKVAERRAEREDS